MSPLEEREWRRTGWMLGGAVLAAFMLFVSVFMYQAFYAPAGVPGIEETFAVPAGSTFDEVAMSLVNRGFVSSTWEFRLAFSLVGGSDIAPGGYTLSHGTNVFGIASTLKEAPSSIWVTIPEGYRKEQVADVLAQALGWTDAQKTEWLTVDTASPAEDREGVYYPDTYLLPRSGTPADVTKRIVAHSSQVFAPYEAEAAAKGEKWTAVLTMASLLEREGQMQDFPTIAGILWNRLDAGMRLQVDATVQYAVGNEGNGWWPTVKPADLKAASPYNTYLHAGLPPAPIANPDLAAIKAALEPATTTCLYYLHDNRGVMHCAATYAEHLAYIRRYLK
ncbi:endolytic transglycosylase MltG [Patescibacteria group bacterium]|nr:endolytic transglycosylase MltG [Patescibacteria group bacterium]